MKGKVLITGATGYVGGRLLRTLEAGRYRVRCLVRDPSRLASGPGREVVRGDLLDPGTLQDALRGIRVAYYLVHSMGGEGEFEALDREAARNFAGAARLSGVGRIVYLGGLGRSDDALSPHLRSRHEVGEILRSSGVPVVELRASIILGAGSLSFEMVRALVERLPVMITPTWVRTLAQPIAMADVIEYLLQAGSVPIEGSPVYEIGGGDRVSYGEIMKEYARQRGLRRLMIPVPVLTPWLSSLWLGLVTPLFARVGRALVESIRNPTVVTDPSADRVFSVRPRGVRDALSLALEEGGGLILDSRSLRVPSSPGEAFEPIRRIGGRTGWYYGNGLWRLRGFLDSLVGGVGMRAGWGAPREPRVGQPLDFWRVEAYEPGRRLRLRAEMKLPGRAWLEFAVEPRSGGSRIWQTAIFDPRGLLGLIYWHALWPIHDRVFDGMLRGVARSATGRRTRPCRASPSIPRR